MLAENPTMFLRWLLKEILRVGAKIHFLAFLPVGMRTCGMRMIGVGLGIGNDSLNSMLGAGFDLLKSHFKQN